MPPVLSRRYSKGLDFLSRLDRTLAGKSDEPAGVIRIFTVDNIHANEVSITDATKIGDNLNCPIICFLGDTFFRNLSLGIWSCTKERAKIRRDQYETMV